MIGQSPVPRMISLIPSIFRLRKSLDLAVGRPVFIQRDTRSQGRARHPSVDYQQIEIDRPDRSSVGAVPDPVKFTLPSSSCRLSRLATSGTVQVAGQRGRRRRRGVEWLLPGRLMSGNRSIALAGAPSTGGLGTPEIRSISAFSLDVPYICMVYSNIRQAEDTHGTHPARTDPRADLPFRSRPPAGRPAAHRPGGAAGLRFPRRRRPRASTSRRWSTRAAWPRNRARPAATGCPPGSGDLPRSWCRCWAGCRPAPWTPRSRISRATSRSSRTTLADELFGLRVRGESMTRRRHPARRRRGGAPPAPAELGRHRGGPGRGRGHRQAAAHARRRVELHPENPDFEPIVPDPDELTLLGKVDRGAALPGAVVIERIASSRLLRRRGADGASPGSAPGAGRSRHAGRVAAVRLRRTVRRDLRRPAPAPR